MKPELVSPAVAWLCSEECDQNGEIIAATAGGYARYSISLQMGFSSIPPSRSRSRWCVIPFGKIRDLSTATPYTGLMGNVEKKLREMGRIKRSDLQPLPDDLLIGLEVGWRALENDWPWPMT